MSIMVTSDLIFQKRYGVIGTGLIICFTGLKCTCHQQNIQYCPTSQDRKWVIFQLEITEDAYDYH